MAVQQRTVGAFIGIPVDDYVVHAQILADTDIVVFDTKGLNGPSVDAVAASPVLFRVSANVTGQTAPFFYSG